MADIIKLLLRRDTEANWIQANPVLAFGEPCVYKKEDGKLVLKIGDGIHTFDELDDASGDLTGILNKLSSLEEDVSIIQGDITNLETYKQNVLTAGDNITIEEETEDGVTTTTISAIVPEDLTERVHTNEHDIEVLQDDVTGLQTNLGNEVLARQTADSGLSGEIDAIELLIPAQATEQNKLADKEFVNSSISTNTANFKGTYENVDDLEAHATNVTNNDYAFVINSVIEYSELEPDFPSVEALEAYSGSLTNFDYAWVVNSTKFDLYRYDIILNQWSLRVQNIEKNQVTLNTAYNRYKATVNDNIVTWAYEYTLNNSSFTAAQWSAINSGITPAGVAQIETNRQAITTKQNELVAGNNVSLTAGTGLDEGKTVIAATDTTYSAGTGLSLSGTQFNLTGSIPYTTTAPTSANTDGGIRIVVLTSEPATRYDGYWYIITSNNNNNNVL